MWKSVFVALAFSPLLAGPTAAAGLSEIPAERVAALSSRLPEQPRGFGPPCANREAWTSAVVERRTTEVRKAAEKLLTQDFPPWDQALYLEYSRDGARPNGERMMNARKAWLYPLVVAECVEGKGRFLPAIQRAVAELDSQPTWTWPAHDRGLRNLRDQNFEVDLLAADTAHDLAQALYMLGDWLPPDLRQRTLSALNQRVFDPVRKSLVGANRDHFWLRADHNWNAVCLKGVVDAALTVLPDRTDRALFAAGAEVYIRNYVAGFGPDGYSSEGPGYWNYGFSHFVALREMLIEATGGELDLFADPKVREIALYGDRIEMLPGNIAAFGDAAPNTRMDAFTRAYANDALNLGQDQHLASVRIDGGQSGNDAPLAKAALLLFVTPKPVGGGARRAADGGGPRGYFASAGVLVSRPAPGDKLAVSIKAGGNGNHSHNDIGAYTVGLGDEQPVGDVGKTQYSAKTFGPDRYSIPGISSWGHPVPVVAGALQGEADKIKPRVISTRFTDETDEITIDMADAYAVPTLRALTRTLVHDRKNGGAISITDAFQFTAPATFEAAITTLGDWKRNPDDSLELWRGNEHLLARIESSAPWTLRAEHSNEEGLSFTRVAIALTAPSESGYIRVRYEPVRP
ncbi:heparinase II/III family protein [uncultured Caulobacter sp.]|uniref:heparinase II/III family protein n=1 Tax=uncultured Caulobacter sp. TaxID=158749 RepID=UPI002634ADFC|nr:heparinase II/III family protein [uncultured Caulobacter sp.]